ncbi:MAG: 2-amino-4-hydroxy-6-hydroxymethyldihydropteridine diphosphokinase [Euryarchaeota archaeon]|nr:2-amino-4-hydroxy-6-hydroxymethyldihydropteridine diphosphokinase [Euryarchaeota archaeon]
MAEVFIGIGSNLGNREEHIARALHFLGKRCDIIKKSSLYETAPVGYKDQRSFLNGVVKMETALRPEELLHFLQKIEKKLGRIKTIKNGPRTIDLDILFYNDIIIDTEELTVPHPKLHKRLFVLEPFNEIEPEFVHPVLKKTVGELRAVLSHKCF